MSSLQHDDEALLAGALRNRSVDAPHLAEFLALSLAETTDALRRLHDRGLLRFDGEHIVYLNPAAVSAAIIREKTAAHTAQLKLQMSALAGLSNQLRVQVADAFPSARAAVASEDEAIFFRGDLAGTDALEYMLDSSRRSGTDHPQILGLMPNPNPPKMTPEHQNRMWTKAANSEGTLRLLLPSPPDAVPKETLLQYAHLGADVRWLNAASSWLWINTLSGEVAVPLVWGEVFPVTVVVMHQPAVVTMAVALFDVHWDLASPIRPSATEFSWEPLLRLMHSGLSLDDAAERLDITSRTARRRLEKGMQHYGVNNFFALGAAWSAELEHGVIPFPAHRFSIHD